MIPEYVHNAPSFTLSIIFFLIENHYKENA